MLPTTRKLLLVDDDVALLEALRTDSYAQKDPPVVASTGREAQLFLADPKMKFSGVFVNPEISYPGGISVIRCAHQHHPATPVFLVHNGANPFTENEMKHLGIHKAIPKPVPYKDILGFVRPIVSMLDFKDVKVDPLSEKVATEVSGVDSEFQAINAEDFLSGTTSFFDVFVRLASGRFLKLLQSGDSFSPERVQSYLKNGVTHFYLKKADQERYLHYCDLITGKLLKSSTAPMSLKVSQTLNHGEETLNLFRNNGVSETNLQYAQAFVGNVTQLVAQLKPGQHPLLKGFLADIAAYEHGIGVVVISGLLVSVLKINSADPVESIGLAGLFHDIALKVSMPDLQVVDESTMTKEQLVIYRKHPFEGAQILSSIPNIKPVVLQAISQHHERRNRKGFPNGLGPGSISLVSEIIGVADEFYNILKRKESDPKFDFVDEIEKKILKSFSSNVVAAFREVFFGSSKTEVFKFSAKS